MTSPIILGRTQPYEEWKQDRQEYLDNRSDWQVMKDSIAYKKYNTDKSYYGLGDEIKARQQSKIPEPGEGTINFFSDLSMVTKPLAKVHWGFAVISAGSRALSEWFRYQVENP